MIKFKELADYTQKEYKLSITEANSFVKGVLDDIEFYKEKKVETLEDYKVYLNKLENYGK